MSERDGYIPGVPCWVDTGHPDPRAALPFYRDLFGWTFDDVGGDGDGQYFIGRIRGGNVAGIGPAGEGAPPAWHTYVWVDDADAAAGRVLGAGGRVVLEPMDVTDAGRMAVCTDPEGASFCVWQAKNNKGAKVVNEHGSLNFNGLATRDPQAAEAFYGAVFGWRLLELPSGLAWALPGYGYHLEELTPGLHEQMDQMGAPEGFVDVVAAVEPIAPGDRETPAHWTITFAVDDADATATLARALGGAVLSGPVDGPWTRMAVLRDPQGATFIASQFVPENRDVVG